MIEYLVHLVFERLGHKWHLKGDRWVVPSEDDIEAALDEAARVLYTSEEGTQLEVGGLIIRKQVPTVGHDVYVYVGSYQ